MFAYTLRKCKGDFILIYQIKCQPEYHFKTQVTQCSEQAPGYFLVPFDVSHHFCFSLSPTLTVPSLPPLTHLSLPLLPYQISCIQKSSETYYLSGVEMIQFGISLMGL